MKDQSLTKKHRHGHQDLSMYAGDLPAVCCVFLSIFQLKIQTLNRLHLACKLHLDVWKYGSSHQP